MGGRKPAFTLIELLIVIVVIGLLMAILIPSVRSAMVAVKVSETRNRIAIVEKAIDEYWRLYGAYPPCTSPNQASKPDDPGSYPVYRYPNGSAAVYLFVHGAGNNHPFPGKFLVYFLMGPNGMGWKRPRTAGSGDVNARNQFITAEWDVPVGLVDFLENRPIYCSGNMNNLDFNSPCFVDAFGHRGYNGGLIAYVPADPRKSGPDRFISASISATYYQDTRSHPSYPGDGKSLSHFKKQVATCSKNFVVMSPGENGKFGYHVYGADHKGEWYKGHWANMDIGLSDDIANFPMKR